MIIQLTKGKQALIDDIDGDLAELRWHARHWIKNNVYAAVRTIGTKPHQRHIYIHRVIMERVLNRALQPGEEVDHVNRNPLDNRRENLRVASSSQNKFNQGLRKNNKSGYVGVTYFKRTGRWVASIQANNVQHHLGYFDTPEEAYVARCEAAKRLHAEFANLE